MSKKEKKAYTFFFCILIITKIATAMTIIASKTNTAINAVGNNDTVIFIS
jgi:hypothetical protein